MIKLFARMNRAERCWAYLMMLMIIAAFFGTTDQVVTFLTGALVILGLEKDK